MIKFSDLDLQYQDNNEEILKNLKFTLEYGEVYRGQHEIELKKFISNLYNNASVQLTSTCTAALHAGILSLNLPKDSRILIPTMTYAATAQSVLNANCIPTFVDIDDSWLLDLNDLTRVYNLYANEVSAVLVVDLYGQGCDIYNLKKWCDERNLKLIIDAAQSFSITTKDYDQTIADAICISFNPYKNFGGAGGGGAIITNKIDTLLLDSICSNGKSFYGFDSNIDNVGFTSRITSIQAALITANIKNYEKIFTRKVQIIKKYCEAFSNHNQIKIPKFAFQNLYNWYVMPIVTNDYEKTCNYLKNAKINYSSHYKHPLHTQKFAKQWNQHQCVKSESLSGKIISLPSHTHLTDEQVDYIIQTVISSL
jgi:3-dehydro-glucose-6-phosphate--glutamate transaminase